MFEGAFEIPSLSFFWIFALLARIADMKEVLGWHPKRANNAINILESEGRIEKISDDKDKRTKRLRSTD